VGFEMNKMDQVLKVISRSLEIKCFRELRIWVIFVF